jgi:FkbM family methyltransferase
MKELLKWMVPTGAQDVTRKMMRGKKGNAPLVNHTYLGHELSICMCDSTAHEWYDHDWEHSDRTEFPELRAAGIPQDGLAFDLGAHQGVVAMLLQREVVPKGRVVAVEMDKWNAKTAQENCANNGFAEVKVINAAVSGEDGVVYSRGASNDRITTSVIYSRMFGNRSESVTINTLAERHGVPDLVYVDIEGAEVLAMKSANNVLGRARVWFFELHGDLCNEFGGTNRTVMAPFLDAHSVRIAKSESAPFEPVAGPNDVPLDRCFAIAASHAS